MPGKKEHEEGLAATHYMMSHATGAHAKGSIISREELDASIGVEKGLSKEDAAKAREPHIKRLLDLGAIVPAEAPKEPAEGEEKPVVLEGMNTRGVGPGPQGAFVPPAPAKEESKEERRKAEEEAAHKQQPPRR